MVYRILQGNMMCHPTIMMRNETIKKHALRYEEYALAEDYKLWLEAAKKGLSFYIIPLILHYYRVSMEQQTTKFRNLQIITSKKIKEEALEYIVQNHHIQCIKNYLKETLNLYWSNYMTLDQTCKTFLSTKEMSDGKGEQFSN